jgi:phage gpG-like protein
MATSIKFGNLQLDKNKLRIFLNTPHSGDRQDLWKWLEKKKKLAVAGAKGMVGVKTGALRKNIVGRHLGNFTGQYVTIGANLPYALMHHQGTKPHVITPKNGKILHFRAGGRSVYTTMVFHPGTKPNPYLRSQLRHFRG